jgi:hypothetical protein
MLVQHPLAGQVGLCDVGCRPGPNRRERRSERLKAMELCFVAGLAPARVVAILLTAARVASRGLEMTAWISTDPDAGPGRGYHQRVNAFEDGRLSDDFAVRSDIPEPERPLLAADAAPIITHVAEPG